MKVTPVQCRGRLALQGAPPRVRIVSQSASRPLHKQNLGRPFAHLRCKDALIQQKRTSSVVPVKGIFLGGSILRALPGVAIAACRRGNRVIVSATLADAPGDISAKDLLAGELEEHPDLQVGTLQNGLRYVLLPNKAPPGRFEAHLEIHAGSVDEASNEQGIAHLVEHVTFLGSKKRESLLGTGARSNAYTDFHHTVFHVHSPERNGNTGEPMLWHVLDALAEIAFEPELLPSRIEKERKAVVAKLR